MIKFKTIESGYAKVYQDGKFVGTVSRRKHGSTRTGTMWFPVCNLDGRTLQCHETREGAARRIVDHRAARFGL
jgi:hypothetical protein